MSAPSNSWHVIAEMENDVANVGRWARALIAMGSSDNHIHPGAAFAIGEALERLGEALEDKWNLTLNAARDNGGGR